MTIDFLNATQGHSVILNFSTIPRGCPRTDKHPSLPSLMQRGGVDLTSRAAELTMPAAKRYGGLLWLLLAWYTQGGFTDELGVHHASGYHYKIPYWEVLNEPEANTTLRPKPTQSSTMQLSWPCGRCNPPPSSSDLLWPSLGAIRIFLSTSSITRIMNPASHSISSPTTFMPVLRRTKSGGAAIHLF